MKTWTLLALIAFFGAAAIFMPGCDNDSADDAASGSGGPEVTGEVSDDDGAGDAAADVTEELDSSPIPQEQFQQLKEQWELQVAGAQESANTLSKINDEYKDEALAKMLEEINSKIESIRARLAETTAADRQFLTVELPKRLTEVGVMQNKAMERMQVIVKAKAGIPE